MPNEAEGRGKVMDSKVAKSPLQNRTDTHGMQWRRVLGLLDSSPMKLILGPKPKPNLNLYFDFDFNLELKLKLKLTHTSSGAN